MLKSIGNFLKSFWNGFAEMAYKEYLLGDTFDRFTFAALTLFLILSTVGVLIPTVLIIINFPFIVIGIVSSIYLYNAFIKFAGNWYQNKNKNDKNKEQA